MFVWIDQMNHCGPNALKAKITDITVQTFGDEIALVYVTEGDFQAYIPYSRGFESGSYLVRGSEGRQSIYLWSMIGTEEDRKRDQEFVHGKKGTETPAS